MATVLLMNGKVMLMQLPDTAESILARAEVHARTHNLAKRSYFPVAIREEVASAGYHVADHDLSLAMQKFDAVRRGESLASVEIQVTASDGHTAKPAKKGNDMSNKQPIAAHKFFESERTYPNADAQVWYDRLVGLDDHKQRFLLELELLLFPDRLAAWSEKHHRRLITACDIMASRAPLILLEGDVGCGKTKLAETIGQPLAARTASKVHLLKLNTQVRGTGMVGEMTDLIVQAFTLAEARSAAVKGDPVLLLIDEADALASKRAEQHMHHEDKAGLNTLLQRIDGVRQKRIAVIFITNRPDALDQAIRRRAALQLTFSRPNDEIRAELIRRCVPELDLTSKQVRDLIAMTGSESKKRHGAIFTPSDITDRLIPASVRQAYTEDRPLVAEDILEQAKLTIPTPLLYDGDADEHHK